MYPTKIIARAKSIVGENVASNRYSADDLMMFFNESVEALYAEARNIFPQAGMISTNITQTASTETTALPDFLDRILRIRDATNTSYERLPVDIMSKAGAGWASDGIKLWWVNLDETNTWELWYTRPPWECHKGTADSATTTTLVLDDTADDLEGDCWEGDAWDDYYKGAYAYITSATLYPGQKAEFTAYAGATRTGTISSWPAGTPTGTIVYEILPIIDCVKWRTILAHEVALRIRALGRDDPAIYHRRHPYGQARRVFRSHWSRVQQRMSDHIRLAAAERQ